MFRPRLNARGPRGGGATAPGRRSAPPAGEPRPRARHDTRATPPSPGASTGPRRAPGDEFAGHAPSGRTFPIPQSPPVTPGAASQPASASATLLGAGRGITVLRGRAGAPVLTIEGGAAELASVTLQAPRHRHGSGILAKGQDARLLVQGCDFDGVAAEAENGGTLTLERCSLAPVRKALAAARGEGATIAVHECILEQKGATGVSARDGARALVDRSTITGKADLGVLAEGRESSCEVRGAQILGSTRAAVLLRDGARGDISASTIMPGAEDGIDVCAGAVATIVDNRVNVAEPEGTGISVRHARAEIQSNLIGSSAAREAVGIWLEGVRAGTNVKENTVSGCHRGIKILERSAAVLERNVLHENTVGCEVRQEAAPRLIDNEIAGGRVALRVRSRAAVTLEGGRLSASETGICVRNPGSNIEIERCKIAIDTPESVGIAVRDRANGRVQDSEVRAPSAVHALGEGTRLVLIGNRVRGGIRFYDATGEILENEVSAQAGPALLLLDPRRGTARPGRSSASPGAMPGLVVAGNEIAGDIVSERDVGLFANDARRIRVITGHQRWSTSPDEILHLEDLRAKDDVQTIEPENVTVPRLNAFGARRGAARDDLTVDRLPLLFRHGATRRAMATARTMIEAGPERGLDPWQALAAACHAPPARLSPAERRWLSAAEGALQASSRQPRTALGRKLEGLLQAETALARKDPAGALACLRRSKADSWSAPRARLALYEALARGSGRSPLDLFPGGVKEGWTTAAACWAGDGPLPPFVVREARRFARCNDLNGLLAAIGRAGLEPGPKGRLARAAIEIFTRPELGGARRALDIPEEGAACGLCQEPVTAETAFKLEQCRCEGTYCQDCVASHIQNSGAARYRDACWGCEAKASRLDIESLPGLADRGIVERVTTRGLTARADFTPCTEPSCPGGFQQPASSANPAPSAFSCALCGTVSLEGSSVDGTILRALIRGLEGSTARNGDGLMRECYHCGIATKKGDGCAHMTCPSCMGEWDFGRGKYGGTPQFFADGFGPQSYRPLKDGVLAKVGVWPADVVPGATLTTEQQQRVLAAARERLERLTGAGRGARSE